MALKQVLVRLPEELQAQAQTEAKRLGISFAEYVREAVVFRLAWDLAWRARTEHESVIDAAERLLRDPLIWPQNDESPSG